MKLNSLRKGKTAAHKNTSEGGFTLTNLIVGASLTALVTAGGGVAVASMLDSTTTSNARSERRVEMNRSLEFIKTEVNRAESLVETASLPTNFKNELSTAQLAVLSDEIDVNSIQTVLQLKLPGSSEEVTYFTATPTGGIWQGPKVLYRFGPKFNASGEYLDLATSANWEPLPLLDKLNAFSAPVSGGTVQLKPEGQIKKLLGRTESYGVSLNTATKEKDLAKADFNPSGGANGSSSTITTTAATVKPLVLSAGNVKVNKESTLEVKFLGGDIVCTRATRVRNGNSNNFRTVYTDIRVNPSAKIEITGGTTESIGWKTYSANETVSRTVKADTTLNITSNNNSSDCSQSFDVNTNTDQGTQVYTLVNGDTVPSVVPYKNQNTIETFVAAYIDSSTGKIKLAENQAIFLFEVGVTNRSSGAFDLQDLVVLATVNPTTTTTTSSPSTTTTSTTTTTTSTTTTATLPKCNNGLGNGSEGCTPGKARPNDEVVRDPLGNIICVPAPGNPCTGAAKSVGL